MSDGKLKARPSLAHLSDKFNTAPPPGYVAGRGRGATGFSKPPADPPKGRGGGGAASSSSSGAGAPSSAAEAPAPPLKAGEKLEGEAGDTRDLGLDETEKFEETELTMDSKEAGYSIEAFSMEGERKEGHFDDDFNFVWRRKGEDPDDVQDAWLSEVDGASAETSEKLAKRRTLLQRQLDTQKQPDEAKLDTPELLRRVVEFLQPKDSSGLYFDPASTLYWTADGLNYYLWDAASGQFVPTASPHAAAAE